MIVMRDILFLVHRIPYPPDKGDKIRSWHFLSYLEDHCQRVSAVFAYKYWGKYRSSLVLLLPGEARVFAETPPRITL